MANSKSNNQSRNSNAKASNEREAFERQNAAIAKYEKGRNNGSRNGKRSNKSNRGRRGKQERIEAAANAPQRTDTSSWNDLSWYSKYPELLVSSASIPFPYKPGMVIHGPTYTDPVSGETKVAKLGVPGVLSVCYDYTIGQSKDKASPASIASNQLFFKIRRAFSGSLATDAPDVFMYTMGLSQIFSYIAFLKRLYRTVTRYSALNNYFPETILKAQLGKFAAGFDIRDFYANKVQLWNYINTLVRMVDAYKVPAFMDIFRRHQFMTEHVYSDVDSMIGQNYVFSPNGWYVLQEQETNPGQYYTQLKYMRFNQFPGYQKVTVQFLFEFGLYMITSFNNWTDALTINGYIMRAYEGETFYSAELLQQDEMLTPEYSQEVLMQIHNLTVLNDFVPDDITQNPLNGAIISNPSVPATFVGNVIVDIPNTSPTAGMVTLASRLAATVSPVTGELICGTEVVTELKLYAVTETGAMTLASNIDDEIYLFVDGNDLYQSSSDWEFFAQKLQQYIAFSQWEGFPRMWLLLGLKDISSLPGWVGHVFTAMLGQLTNPTAITAEELQNIHRVCLYSEFDAFL